MFAYQIFTISQSEMDKISVKPLPCPSGVTLVTLAMHRRLPKGYQKFLASFISRRTRKSPFSSLSPFRFRVPHQNRQLLTPQSPRSASWSASVPIPFRVEYIQSRACRARQTSRPHIVSPMRMHNVADFSLSVTLTVNSLSS